MVFDHVYEIGGFAAGNGSVDQFKRDSLGVLCIGFGDVLVVQHLGHDAVASLRAAFGVAVRGGIIIGSANDTGEIGALGETELTHVFAEVSDAGFGKAADA